MFKLIRKSYYKVITFWGSKVSHNLYYNYEKWEKILEKEPSLYRHCELSMFDSRDFMDKLLSNPRFDKEDFADYLISKYQDNIHEVYGIVYNTDLASDRVIMEKLVQLDGKFFGMLGGDLVNDKMYELAKKAVNNKFDISNRILRARKLSKDSIKWWYEKDKTSVLELLRVGNQVPVDMLKEILINGNFSFEELVGLRLGHLSKEDMLELARIDGRILVSATGKNISIEAYREAINNSDPNKRFETSYISSMDDLQFDLDNDVFLDLCREDGNFFMFCHSNLNVEEAYNIAISNSDPAKRFDIDNFFEFVGSSLNDTRLCKRLVELDGRFLSAARDIDLATYRKAKANGYNIKMGFGGHLYFRHIEENIEEFIELIQEEPKLLEHIQVNFYDVEFTKKFIDIIVSKKIEFPFNFKILEEIKEDSKGEFNKLIHFYKDMLSKNELSKEQLNLLFNYYSSNRKDPFYKFIKSKVCEVYGIDENFLDYQLEFGSRVNIDFGVTLNPEMLQKKYAVLYEGKGHDTYSRLYILGTFPSIQKKIISIGTEVKGESLGNSSRRIELLKKMLDSAISNDEFGVSEEWIPKFSHIVQYVNNNMPMFSYFADHLDELDDKQIALLTSHALSLHKFTINSMDELNNYAEVRRRYIEKKYNEGTLSSVKEAFIEECFGMSPLMYKRMLMFKDGVLEARDKYDPEIVKLFEKISIVEGVANPAQFLSARKNIDTKELGQFYSENNFRYLHLMMGIKKTILSDYNNSLYHCKDEDSLEYEGCRLYKVAGEDGSKPFNLSITSLGAYSSFDPFQRGFSFKENWNMPLVASHGICSTYLGNNNLGTARVDCVILGFTDYEEGALLTGGPYDLGSNASNKTFDAFSNLSNSMFLHPKALIDYTRHTHNEMVFERRYMDGKRQPNYVVLDVDDLDKAMALYEKYNKSGRYVFDGKMKKGFQEGDRTEEERQADLVYFALKCSKDFGIPIVVVEREKIAQNEWKKIVVSLKEVMDKEDFSKEEVHELLHDIFVDFENNAVGNTYHKHINDKYFNHTNGELLVDSIKSKITVLMRENPVVAGYFLDELESLCSLEMDKLGLYRKNRSNSGIDYNWLGNYVETQRQLLSNSVISTKYVGDLLTGKIGDEECLMEYSTHFKAGDDQLDISDVRKIIVDDDKLAVKFNLAVSMIDTYRLYEDRDKTAHSRKHVEDVVLFSTVIGKSLGFDDNDMDLLLAAAVFHDSGRIDDRNVSHAVSSAKLVEEKLIGVFPKEDLAMIQAIIEYHELRDKRTPDGKIDYSQLIELCEKYGISRQDQEKIDKCIKLSSVLKDADALDRTRFVAQSKAFLNPNYLRHDVSKKLFKVSVQLNEYYSKKDIEQTLTEKPELIDTFKEALDMTKSPKEVIRMYRKGKLVEEQKESEVVINGAKK